MTNTISEQAVFERFSNRYRHVQSDVVKAIERSVCGCDYGASSWTTVDEIEKIIELLGLSKADHLLEIGSGTGWPGLFLAEKIACSATLTDLPLEGLNLALDRATRDGLQERIAVVAASGNLLPFNNEFFDAVFHSDVLCCLPDKKAVLMECRRSVRREGCMVFPVIFPAAGLSDKDYALAIQGGPPFVEIQQSYPEMLVQTGWKVTDQSDITEEYASSLALMADKLTQHGDELEDLMGQEAAVEERTRRTRAAEASARGILRRELYRAIPV